MGDPLDTNGHGADIKDETRQDKGGQEGDDNGHLPGHELGARDRGDKQAHGDGGEHEQGRGQGQGGKRTVQRHMEEEDSHAYREQHTAHPQDEIGHDFSQQDLFYPHRRHQQGLHGAAFPFPGNHHGGEHGADERHDDRDQPRYQIVATAHSRIIPDPLFDLDRNMQRSAKLGRCSAEPLQPDPVDVALEEPGLVGIDAVDDNRNRGPAAGAQLPGKIRPQPDNTVHPPLHHGALGLLDGKHHPGGKILGLVKPADQGRGLGAGLFHHQGNGHIAGIKGHPVTEQEQEHNRQKKGDADTGRITDDLQALLADQAAHPHAGFFPIHWLREQRVTVMGVPVHQRLPDLFRALGIPEQVPVLGINGALIDQKIHVNGLTPE